MTEILFHCTGNATRSVMAGVALAWLRPDIRVKMADTLIVDGVPTSFRTRVALEDVSLSQPAHRSRQAGLVHFETADLVIGLAPEIELEQREEVADPGGCEVDVSVVHDREVASPIDRLAELP